MISRKAAMVLTVVGGAFYTVGGILGLGGLVLGILRVGLVAGPVIILAGILVNSKRRKVRWKGGSLAIVGILVAAAYGCGGLLAGLILTLAGSIFGIRYKEPVAISASPSQVPPVVDRGAGCPPDTQEGG